jgi:hypothetical protein
MSGNGDRIAPCPGGEAVTIVNLFLLAIQLATDDVANAQGEAPILRGRALELVDAGGKVRAEFTVEPSGEAGFRMRDGGGSSRPDPAPAVDPRGEGGGSTKGGFAWSRT